MSKEIIIKTKRTTNYVYLSDKGSDMPMVFLHGFTGSHHSWDNVIEKLKRRTLTLDLPGHGKSTFNDLDANYSIDDWCEDFNEILNSLNIDKVDLCGYSMGGRLATGFAIKYPEKINKLILESTSFGIENKDEREARLKEDLRLCRLIEEDSPKFVQKWENSPLFAKQQDRNPQGFLSQRKERLSHNPIQLSKALKSFSQGNMGFYKSKMTEFKFPLILINGSEDGRYIEIGKNIIGICRDFNQHVIEDCGHNIHLENLDKFVEKLL